MKPLKIALFHRASDRCIDRMFGMWSYPVPEFEWTHFPMAREFLFDAGRLSGYDWIVYEDGKCYGTFTNRRIPLAYVVTDSTLSEEHYRIRRQLAEYADVVLVDWDRLERFAPLNVKRLSYCVNDRFFRDYGLPRTVDVGFYATMDGGRRELDAWLKGFCKARGYNYASGSRKGLAYAHAFNSSKIVVNLNRNATTRAHRTFDVMASRACFLTDPPPPVSDEYREAGKHYITYESERELGERIDWLLAGDWQSIANAGYEMVLEHHTWTVRARELRAILDGIH